MTMMMLMMMMDDVSCSTMSLSFLFFSRMHGRLPATRILDLAPALVGARRLALFFFCLVVLASGRLCLLLAASQNPLPRLLYGVVFVLVNLYGQPLAALQGYDSHSMVDLVFEESIDVALQLLNYILQLLAGLLRQQEVPLCHDVIADEFLINSHLIACCSTSSLLTQVNIFYSVQFYMNLFFK